MASKYIEFDKDDLKKLMKVAGKIDTKYIDRNYNEDHLPDLLEYFNILSNNILFLDVRLKKIKMLLQRYYSNKITDAEIEVLGYTERCCIHLDKKEIEASIDTNSKYYNELSNLKELENLLKNVENSIQRYKYRSQDIKNLIEYRRLTNT